MPDPNKLKRLEELGYTIGPCCGLCRYSKIGAASDWGTCQIHRYEHTKHGFERNLSVNRAGRCPKFKVAETKKADLARSGFLRLTAYSIHPEDIAREANR